MMLPVHKPINIFIFYQMDWTGYLIESPKSIFCLVKIFKVCIPVLSATESLRLRYFYEVPGTIFKKLASPSTDCDAYQLKFYNG